MELFYPTTSHRLSMYLQTTNEQTERVRQDFMGLSLKRRKWCTTSSSKAKRSRLSSFPDIKTAFLLTNFVFLEWPGANTKIFVACAFIREEDKVDRAATSVTKNKIYKIDHPQHIIKSWTGVLYCGCPSVLQGCRVRSSLAMYHARNCRI